MDLKLIQKISALSESYKEMVLETAPAFEGENNLKKVLNDWYLSLIFFFDRVYYQGRRDAVSGQFELATIRALDLFFQDPTSSNLRELGKNGFLEWKNYGFLKDAKPVEGKYSKHLYNYLTKTYDFIHEEKEITSHTGKQRDRAMVVDTLKFISTIPDYNILHYSIKQIKEGKIKELDHDLREIRQVGQKTCSLFLRDTVSFYNLESYLSTSDFDVVQPVDTWVHQMAKKLGIIDQDMKLSELVQKRHLIPMAAIKAKVSPIDFNQGLWYLPTHAVDLLLVEYKKHWKKNKNRF